MLKRKAVAIAAAAGLFYWAPSTVPVPVRNTQVAVTCGVPLASLPADSAFAAAPCFTPVPQNAGTPIPVIGIFAGTLSIMINAAIVWSTQCRELTTAEALTAMALPGIGIAINNTNVMNQCQPH